MTKSTLPSLPVTQSEPATDAPTNCAESTGSVAVLESSENKSNATTQIVLEVCVTLGHKQDMNLLTTFGDAYVFLKNNSAVPHVIVAKTETHDVLLRLPRRNSMNALLVGFLKKGSNGKPTFLRSSIGAYLPTVGAECVVRNLIKNYGL